MKFENMNLTYEGLIPRIQKSFLSKDVDAMQPHIRAFVERAVTFTTCPECGGTRLNEAARSSKIKDDQHRRRLRDADQRPGRVGARPEGAVGRAAAGNAAPHARLVRGDRARLPQSRPAVRHAVGRRGAAHQDDPPPRLVAHRRHLRLRRADDRAAPARHPAHERPAAAAARQGQHRPGGRAQAGDDRDRRPRRRSRSRRRHRRRRGGVRRHRRRAAGQRHAHRASPERPRRREAVGADAVGRDEGARRPHAQPAERRRRHPARRAGGGDRRGRFGQELADSWLGVRPGRGGVGRSDARSAARGGATRRPTPVCSSRFARRSRRPTA